MSERDIKQIVKEKYGQVALRVASSDSSCCGGTSSQGDCDPITSNLYAATETAALPDAAVDEPPFVEIWIPVLRAGREGRVNHKFGLPTPWPPKTRGSAPSSGKLIARGSWAADAGSGQPCRCPTTSLSPTPWAPCSIRL